MRPAAAGHRSPPDSIVTRVLGTLPPQFSDQFITGLESVRDTSDIHVRARRRLNLSSDGLHMAFVLDLVTSRLMIVDGVRGKTYGYVSRGAFSREGGHFAYFAGPSEQAGPKLVLDGRETILGVYARSPLTLSADGRHWAFVGQTRRDPGQRFFVVTDRGTGRPYDTIGPVALSWDGSHVGYVAQNWNRSVVVIDDVEGPSFSEVTTPIFDLSGAHTAYAARAGSSWYVVRDGKQSEPYPALELTSIRFSADGARLAYVARIGTNSALFVDGEPGEPEPSIIADSSCFSRDGKHTLVWAERGSWIPVRDGHELGNRDTQCPGALAISADGAHVAYSECTGFKGTWHVVYDGVPGPECDAVGVPRLSPDGKRVAYVARRGEFQAVVVDGVVGALFGAVGDPTFSPDGAHEAHVVRLTNNRAFVMLDDRSGPEFDWISPEGPTFQPDGRLEYLAVRNSELLRVSLVPRVVE